MRPVGREGSDECTAGAKSDTYDCLVFCFQLFLIFLQTSYRIVLYRYDIMPLHKCRRPPVPDPIYLSKSCQVAQREKILCEFLLKELHETAPVTTLRVTAFERKLPLTEADPESTSTITAAGARPPGAPSQKDRSMAALSGRQASRLTSVAQVGGATFAGLTDSVVSAILT